MVLDERTTILNSMAGRPGPDEQLYVRRPDGWKLTFHQLTPR
jgi:hypothetical protein